jgi:exodeoxyribonuclease-5
MNLSEDQQAALTAIRAWIATPGETMTLAGLAGTGKTTIINELLKSLKGTVSVCAFTGKAASVLRSKGVYDACTIHKLIYMPETRCRKCDVVIDGNKACFTCHSKKHLKVKFVRVPFVDSDLVIVDEASMVNAWISEDLESLSSKVLYVGDHGQLEPIGDDPGIMSEPDIRLEKIHRQAEKSPIIQFAHHVRAGKYPSSWEWNTDEVWVHQNEKPTGTKLNEFDIVLCGYNNTRVAVNRAIRRIRGFEGGLPRAGERLICLQNDTELGVFNGLLVTVKSRRGSDGYPKYDLEDDAGEFYFDVPMHPEQFGQERKLDDRQKGLGMFDFGYCLTTHKSQGSEWEKVAVLEQIARTWDSARWRYTAATRASKRLEWWISGGR